MIIAAGIIYFLHKGLVDVKMWTRMPNQLWIRQKYSWLIGDGVYLIGTVIMYLLIVFTSWFHGRDVSCFPMLLKDIAVGMLIGGECWDLVFGYIVDADCFYAFPDWYGGYGFHNRSERILFDVVRVCSAIIIWIVF